MKNHYLASLHVTIIISLISLLPSIAQAQGTGNCPYSEGQYLFTTNWGESVYTHLYNNILYAAYQNGSDFKPQHWLIATGQMTTSQASCFAENDPHTSAPTTNPNPTPSSSNCSYIEGQFLFATSWGESVYAHYRNGIL